MQKLYSQLIGIPIIENSGDVLGLVHDVLIDPENGKVLAFFLSRNRIIVPMDIERINSGLHIHDREHILELHEVLRVQAVHEKGITLIGSRVFAEKQSEPLGRVVDFDIDTVTMTLSHVHCAKLFFFFRFQERIIGSRNIVRIEKNRVTVRDRTDSPVSEKSVARSQAYA